MQNNELLLKLIAMLFDKENNCSYQTIGQPLTATLSSTRNLIYDQYIGKMCIVRTYAAGVFFAEVMEIESGEGVGHAIAILNKCRRIWKWSGATELSDLAENGIKNKSDSRISVPTDRHLALGVVEILLCSEKCINNINSIPNWSEHE